MAKDGGEPLFMLNQSPLPDVIVPDLNLPCISGKDCLKAIRKNNKYEKAPVVIYSTLRNTSNVKECLQHGANHYVTKPGSIEALCTLVKKIYDREMAGNSKGMKYALN